MENFDELKLADPLTRAIGEMGFVKPTPIQAKALPILLKGPTDFLGLAATGTGKTAAFSLPLLQRLVTGGKTKGVQALVLCPTRELAVQVTEQVNLLGKYAGIRAVAVYGGAGYGPQIEGLRQGASVVVATPGRLIDHLKRGTMSIEKVGVVILDEADEMISMGFKEDLETILSSTQTEGRNIWLFSATLNPVLRRVAETYMKKPQSAEVNQAKMLSGTVRQIYYTVRDKNKAKGLCKLIDHAEEFYGIVFCQTKQLVMELTDFLKLRGYRVDCLHGDKDQRSRDRSMGLFKEKKVNILVCTDVAARGLDVKDLTHVINYSLPREMDSYIHRIGRTARSGKEGLAISLVSPSEVYLVQRIEKVTKSKMEGGIFPSYKLISEKKLARYLPTFASAPNFNRAEAVLDDAWKATLEAMSKTEIASRFLALAFPNQFDDSEKGEDVGLKSEIERKPLELRGASGPRKKFRSRAFRGGFSRDREDGSRRPNRYSGSRFPSKKRTKPSGPPFPKRGGGPKRPTRPE